jgi:peptide/nickel transport system permease protein
MSPQSEASSPVGVSPTVEGRSRFRVRPSRGFVRFVARRLAALVLLGIGITFVAFVLTQLVPGDPAIANLGQNATPEAIAAYHERYNMDDPLPTQYVNYLQRVLQGDLGQSQQTQNPVTDDLRALVPATAELALLSILIASIAGVGLGVLAALWRDRPLDYVLRAVSLSGVSVPTFWLALVAIYVLFFQYAVFPGGDRLDAGVAPPPDVTGLYTVDAVLARDWATLWNALHHLILPALVLAAFNVGVLLRYARSAVLEVIEQDYIRAARAKGLPERTVVLRHMLRAALPSIVTVIGLMFANVMTGAVLVESIFAWPGLGQYGYHAATSLDLPAIMGVSLFVAVIYILVNFVVDVLYGVLDPRIRLT